MADPVLVCALAYASFVSFVGYHGDLSAYAKDIDSLNYLVEELADLADLLTLCGGHDREIAQLAKLSRQAANQVHALEDQAARAGVPRQ